MTMTMTLAVARPLAVSVFSPLLVALSLFLAPSADAAPASPAKTATKTATQPVEVRIQVKGGYHPSPASVPEGVPLRLVFTRTESSGCSREVVVPAVNVKKELPRDQAVVIDVPAQKPGKLEFRCGMDMLKGHVTVTPKR